MIPQKKNAPDDPAGGYICSDCPRRCAARRDEYGGAGFCRTGSVPRAARAALHFWEEPCISGTRGSGAVFFSGCALRCVYCQNAQISAGGFGEELSVQRLREIYARLIAQGAHNINLVTPTHFLRAVRASLTPRLSVPVVWNCGGYESAEALRSLEGLVQIYLPDLKYADAALAARLSAAPDYPETARAAVLEMFRQTGPYVMGDDGLLRSGVVIRHLVLPGQLENTFRVIDWVAETFSPGDVLFSLMSQYTPTAAVRGAGALGRGLTQAEHDAAVARLEQAGIEDGFYQDRGSASESFIPAFDLTGLR